MIYCSVQNNHFLTFQGCEHLKVLPVTMNVCEKYALSILSNGADILNIKYVISHGTQDVWQYYLHKTRTC